MKHALCLLVLAALTAAAATAQTPDSYFVSTSSDADAQGADAPQAEAPAAQSPEERFLEAHFPTLSLCDWTAGMRFMVIPGERDEFLRTFTDSLSGLEVGTGTLRHKILVYKGHETTATGWEHLNFRAEDTGKAYYVELRNLAFADYCRKTENGGVRALAYLGDVDKARELLTGKELFTRGDVFYQDDKNTPDGFREVGLAEDTRVTVERVGVGSRDFPVKLVARAEDGALYFQQVAMSRINCSLVSDDFYRENARHLFTGSFAFGSKTGKKSATMSAKLLGKKINSRQAVTVTDRDGQRRVMRKNTVFLVKDIQGERGTDYYTLTLGHEGSDYTARVTFQNKDVSGNIDGKQEAYFYELFSVGEAFHANNSVITHTATLTSTGGYAGMVSGIVGKGMTQAQVKMTKGEPDRKWTNKNGTVSWQYLEETVNFRRGRVVSVTSRF